MEIKIQQNPMWWIDIYLFERRDRDIYLIQPVELEMKKHDEWTQAEPTIRFHWLEWFEFIDAITKYVHENKLDKKYESRLEWENERMQDHLIDMKKIVWKLLWINLSDNIILVDENNQK